MLARRQRTQLNRALSKLGLCSRGLAAAWIAQGRVRVNGEIASSPEQWVELGSDRIEVAPGETVGAGEKGNAPATPAARIYLCMHKPPGYVTSRSDEMGRKTIYDLLPPEWRGGWIFPVGRLDRDSEGLLLLTNDGAWSDLLTDPARHVAKVYRVKLDRRPGPLDLERFRSGIDLDGRPTAPAGVVAEGGGWYRVTLTEGRNRQIRRMFHALGYKVRRLVRVSIGSLELGECVPGTVRPLTESETEGLAEPAR
ncbi:MAG: rRNA pseudouridine synthase [Fibrobacteres bacterium]|jgi:23S rRNA pseudouridine2605 synthase|nr:rRNA pseudouridine synthase [Fibrobacterota bacterium]